MHTITCDQIENDSPGDDTIQDGSTKTTQTVRRENAQEGSGLAVSLRLDEELAWT